MNKFINRVGEQVLSNQGYVMTIIAYRNNKDIDIQFDDEQNTIVEHKCYGDFKRGAIRNPNNKTINGVCKVGLESMSTEGYMMTIIDYRIHTDIDIQFDDGTIVKHKRYANFESGKVKNPNHRSVYGVGYLGLGSYSPKKDKKAYQTWHSMFERCYDSKSLLKRPSYAGCSVSKDFHCFQDFAEWFYDNYYEIPNEKMCLDKDILYKGNRIYGPSTCIFAPNNINVMFIKNDSVRGNLPIGIHFNEKINKYIARCCNNSGERVHIGCYDSIEDAFAAYKEYKEQTIKDVADKYKDVIPQQLYDAMYNYIVEIDD